VILRLYRGEQIYRGYRDKEVAFVFKCETKPTMYITYEEIYKAVGRLASSLRGQGVKKGDKVVAYMPFFFKNILWFDFRIAVIKNIFKAFDILLYLIFCELGTYPDDETGYFGHMGLPLFGQQST
jgi:hypothetical protein